MKRALSANVARVLLGACLVVGGGCEDELAVRTTGGQGTSVAPAKGPDVEGAESVAALFARAQKAARDGDDRALVLAIRPETRELWLRDLVVDVAVESSDQPIDADADRVRRAKFRRVLSAFGAQLAARPTSLVRLGDSLLERVRDRVGLFSALLELARSEGQPFDPVRALTRGTVTTPTGLPMLRLVERVRDPAVLTELSLAPAASGSAASVVALPSGTPSASPMVRPLAPGPAVVFVGAPSGALPLRLWSDGRTVWLDES